MDFEDNTRMKLRERNKESATGVACQGRNRANGIGSKKQTSWQQGDMTLIEMKIAVSDRKIVIGNQLYA